jgi:PAS domain S-box-containing protein
VTAVFFSTDMPKTSSRKTSQTNTKPIKKTAERIAADLVAANRKLRREIAERKQVDERLRKLSRAIEQSPMTVVITDLNGTIEYVNPKFVQLTGYSVEEALGQNPRIVKSGETSPEEYKRLWATITAGQAWHGILHNKKKSGELYWEETIISPVFDANGKITHFVAVKEDITERKQAEQALRESEERIRSILDTTVNGIIITNERGIVESINRAARSMFGYAENEIIGQNIKMLMPDPYHTEHDGYIDNYLRTGTKKIIGIGREVTVLRKNGTTFPMSLAVSEVLVGGLHLFTGIVQDITERKQAEQFIEHEKQKYEELFNIAQRQAQEMALLNEVQTALAREVDLSDLIRTVVEAIAKAFGYTHVSVYLQQNDVLHLQYQVGYEHPLLEISMTKGVMARSVRTGSMIFLDDVRSDPDFIGAMGGITSEICVPLFDQRTAVGALNVESTIGHRLAEADANLMGAIGKQVNNAISRARLYDALRQSEHRYKELVDNAREMIYKTDAHGHFTFVNPTATRLIGYSENELIGRSYFELIPLDGRRTVAHFYLDQFRTKTLTTYFEFPVTTKAGPIIWIGQNVQLILDPASGQILETQAVARDVTDLKQAQQTLQQQMIELDARNAELDAFGHTVAHDLKSPTSAVIGFSDLLSTDWGALTDEQRDNALRSLSRSGHKINAIIDELMLLSGVRQQQVVPEPIEMADLIEEALQRLTFASQESKAEISWPDRASWPGALGYAPWIEEVWYNYLSNAIKYGGQPPRIKLGASTQLDGTVSFWVQDNGVGLNPEEQSRLFTPFTRLSQVRATGHGLGLSIVQRIIEKLGGEVGVESQPGHGSTFFFTLPIAPRDN